MKVRPSILTLTAVLLWMSLGSGCSEESPAEPAPVVLSEDITLQKLLINGEPIEDGFRLPLDVPMEVVVTGTRREGFELGVVQVEIVHADTGVIMQACNTQEVRNTADGGFSAIMSMRMIPEKAGRCPVVIEGVHLADTSESPQFMAISGELVAPEN